MKTSTRPSIPTALLALAATLAVLVLTSCSTRPAEMSITHVDGWGGADSLTYVIEASGYGVEGGGTVSYVFECERFPDGTSVLTVTTDEGDPVATATRAPDGSVTLETASGFTASSASGTVAITEVDREHLSLAEWALLDASIFSWYEMPPDLPDEADLLAWRNDLALVESVEPVAENALSPQFWEDAFTSFRFFGSGDPVRITITCIPF